MKKHIIIALTLLLLIPEGCKKYEDGSWISFRSPIKRLLGGWTIESYKVNGVEKIQEYNDSCGCKLSFAIYSTSGKKTEGDHALLVRNCAFDDTSQMYLSYKLTDNDKRLHLIPGTK